MEWVGEALHLELLEQLLELGLDPSEAGFKLFPLWPRPCNPQWASSDIAEDPSFIEAVALLVHTLLSKDYSGTAFIDEIRFWRHYSITKSCFDEGLYGSKVTAPLQPGFSIVRKKFPRPDGFAPCCPESKDVRLLDRKRFFEFNRC
jgi:hypothetical protein